MFFDSWSSLIRVVAVGLPAYVALILHHRISGKRTLAKYYAFDLIVTVAFKSTLSAGLLSPDPGNLTGGRGYERTGGGSRDEWRPEAIACRRPVTAGSV